MERAESAESRRQARRRARRSWPVRKFRLGSEPSSDLSATTTPGQRLDMMWPLALEAWSLTGRPLPEYKRAETPIHVIRRSSESQ